MSQLCFLSATELAALLQKRRISAYELMLAHLEQIERVNPRLNAIVTLLSAEWALAAADAADAALQEGDSLGPLHGLPIAHKDLADTAGIRTTYGSPIFVDHFPAQNSLIVDRLQSAGAITIGKTNTPEFGAGSQTFNTIFGATRNPYDLSKTCGGSSGGAAVALASGMLPIADGSDMGGSLRNPAGFCNVVGFRPSPGRVPDWPRTNAWSTLSTSGPMARTVEDVALMLTAIAGPDPRSPISIHEPASRFAEPLQRDFRGVRVAWSQNLGDLPVDPRVNATLDSQRRIFSDLGCIVEEDQPDLRHADEIFKILRAWYFEIGYGDLLAKERASMKETVIWNVEEGRKLSARQLGRAQVKRTQLYHRVCHFLEKYEYLMLPVSQVPPFAIEQEFVTQIKTANGVVEMETYIDWMKSCYYITVTGLPALSLPCGFTEEGLPVGLQIVGRPWDDFGVLQLGYAFQEATGFGKRRPDLAAIR